MRSGEFFDGAHHFRNYEIHKSSLSGGPFRLCMASFGNRTIFVLVLSLQAACQAQCGELIAFYRFNTNGEDSLGRNRPFGLTDCAPNNRAIGLTPTFIVAEPPLTNGVLYLDGRYEPNGFRLNNYLGTPLFKNFDYRSFAISLDFCPLPLMPPPRPFWKLEQKLDLWTHGRYSRRFGYHAHPNVFDPCNIITGGHSYRWIGFNRRDNKLHLTLNNGAFEHRCGNV
jgi:hypothetical protein